MQETHFKMEHIPAILWGEAAAPTPKKKAALQRGRL